MAGRALGSRNRQRRSSATTGCCVDGAEAQLANFWQDIAVDLQKDRVYLPLDLLARHGYSVEDRAFPDRMASPERNRNRPRRDPHIGGS
jgi:phytoene/squalene synthetase